MPSHTIMYGGERLDAPYHFQSTELTGQNPMENIQGPIGSQHPNRLTTSSNSPSESFAGLETIDPLVTSIGESQPDLFNDISLRRVASTKSAPGYAIGNDIDDALLLDFSDIAVVRSPPHPHSAFHSQNIPEEDGMKRLSRSPSIQGISLIDNRSHSIGSSSPDWSQFLNLSPTPDHEDSTMAQTLYKSRDTSVNRVELGSERSIEDPAIASYSDYRGLGIQRSQSPSPDAQGDFAKLDPRTVLLNLRRMEASLENLFLQLSLAGQDGRHVTGDIGRYPCGDFNFNDPSRGNTTAEARCFNFDTQLIQSRWFQPQIRKLLSQARTESAEVLRNQAQGIKNLSNSVRLPALRYCTGHIGIGADQTGFGTDQNGISAAQSFSMSIIHYAFTPPWPLKTWSVVEKMEDWDCNYDITWEAAMLQSFTLYKTDCILHDEDCDNETLDTYPTSPLIKTGFDGSISIPSVSFKTLYAGIQHFAEILISDGDLTMEADKTRINNKGKAFFPLSVRSKCTAKHRCCQHPRCLVNLTPWRIYADVGERLRIVDLSGNYDIDLISCVLECGCPTLIRNPVPILN